MTHRIFVLVVVVLLAIYGCGGNDNEIREIREIHTYLTDESFICEYAYRNFQMPDSIYDDSLPAELGWLRAIVTSKTYRVKEDNLVVNFFTTDSTFLQYRSYFNGLHFDSLLQVGSEVRLMPRGIKRLNENDIILVSEQMPFMLKSDIETVRTFYE